MSNLQVSSFIDSFMQATDRAAAVAALLTGGTVTADAPVINATQTWNNAGVAFTADKIDVTDSASAAGSLLLDRRVGGVSKFNVSKAGNLSFGNGASLGSISANGVGRVLISATLGAGATVYGSLAIGGTNDTILERDAANTLAQRNGANAQTHRIYNTYTDASNYERGVIGWSANTLTIGTEAAGSGSARSLQIVRGGVTKMAFFGSQISIGEKIYFDTDNTYDIGASGTNRPRNVYVGTDVNVGNDLIAARHSRLGANGLFYWANRAQIGSPSDGVIRLQNSAQNSFTRIELGEADLGISRGTGDPEGSVTAKVGSLYLRTDGGAGTTLYVKESGTGNTGWSAK